MKTDVACHDKKHWTIPIHWLNSELINICFNSDVKVKWRFSFLYVFYITLNIIMMLQKCLINHLRASIAKEQTNNTYKDKSQMK